MPSSDQAFDKQREAPTPLCFPPPPRYGQYKQQCDQVLDPSPPSNYWHVFPRGVVPACIAAPSAPGPAATVTIPTVPRCAHTNCNIKRIHKHCPSRMCKTHCDSSGHCAVHPAQPQPQPLSSPSLSLPSSPLSKLAEQACAYSDYVPRAAHKLALQQRQIQDDRALALALATPLPPSPTPSEEAVHDRLLKPFTNPSPTRTTAALTLNLELERTITVHSYKRYKTRPPGATPGHSRSMMPGVKMKRPPAVDPAYGAGASSGGLAKKAEKKAEKKKTCTNFLITRVNTYCQRQHGLLCP
ncbi:hypothetical protein B0H16DRAFT_1829699 [Mycena metata]|uniref:Uncharacterized protein n=1 Tax=Mycena metata TaxID=1033252 RepID=A0AAD7KBE0_9AGAR|nr:hypothetical protein B0H16DRAFT_1829699 [Mycena metata]